MARAKSDLVELIESVVDARIKYLIDNGHLGNVTFNKNKNENENKTAYQRTEQLLFRYNDFKKLVRDKEREIEEIRRYGVCERGSAVVMYGGNCGGRPRGIVLDEERVADAVRNVQKSMESVVQAIKLIETNVQALCGDPYYKILEMRYFEGRTQEDIAVEFNCTQQNIAYHKRRLVNELAIKMFPDKVIDEYLN